MTEPITEPWFLLYYGQSPDGRGTPDYIGRTTNVSVAEAHARKCHADSYCTGYVLQVTDTTTRRIWSRADWMAADGN